MTQNKDKQQEEKLYKCMAVNIMCIHKYSDKRYNIPLCHINAICKNKEKFIPVEPEPKESMKYLCMYFYNGDCLNKKRQAHYKEHKICSYSIDMQQKCRFFTKLKPEGEQGKPKYIPPCQSYIEGICGYDDCIPLPLYSKSPICSEYKKPVKPEGEQEVKESMDIHSLKGTKVEYAFPNAGYPHDQQQAKEYLKLGEIYTVEKTVVGGWHTGVYLLEKPGIAFNSVMFAETKQPEQEKCGRYIERFEGKLELEKMQYVCIERPGNKCDKLNPRLVGVIRTKKGASNIANIENTLWHLNGKQVEIIINEVGTGLKSKVEGVGEILYQLIREGRLTGTSELALRNLAKTCGYTLRQSIERETTAKVEKIFGEWSPDNDWLNETLYELARQCTKSKYDRSAYCNKTAEEIKIIVKQKLKEMGK